MDRDEAVAALVTERFGPPPPPAKPRPRRRKKPAVDAFEVLKRDTQRSGGGDDA